MRRAPSFVRMSVCLVVFGALALARGSQGVSGQIPPSGPAATAAFEVLHDFPVPFRNPAAAPTRTPDGSLWGTLEFGGPLQAGGIYRVSPDGTARIVHEFAGTDGGNPSGELLLANDGFLYGASRHQSGHAGTLFRIDSSTESLTVVYTFPASGSNGVHPSILTAGPDGLLYGTTSLGGPAGSGTIFRLDRSTGIVSLLAPFGTGSLPGRNPIRGLTLAADGKLYGTTTEGGSSGTGTIYRLDPVTGAATTVYHFTGVPNAIRPQGGLLSSDGFLYGTTSEGGMFNAGTLYRFSPASFTLTIAHAFAFGGPTGIRPIRSPARGADGLIYGVSQPEAGSSGGILYRFNPQTGFTTPATTFSPGVGVLTGFTAGADGLLYGATQAGGAAGLGTLYSFNPFTSLLTTRHEFEGPSEAGYAPFSGPVQAPDGQLYGTTDGIGAVRGSLFRLDPVSGELSSLHSFTGGDVGFFPRAPLTVAPDGSLYGTTLSGEASAGSIFRFDPVSGLITAEHAFSGSDRATQYAGLLTASDGQLYGVTESGGSASFGSIFRFDPVSRVRTTIHSFGGATDAARLPRGALMQGADGFIYGTTALGGGPGAGGTLFRLDPVTGSVTTLHAFSTFGAAGHSPLAGVMEASDGLLYGVTRNGGSESRGTIYRYDRTAGTLTTVHSFSMVPPSGTFPVGQPVEAADGFLYGLASGGGSAGLGAVYRLDRETGIVTTLFSLTAETGTVPQGSLTRALDGNLYGTTISGGPRGGGTVFRIRLNAPPLAEDLPSVKTDEDTAVDDRLRATDPEGRPVAFAIVSNPTNGTVVLTDAATGAFTYTPSPDFTGDDAFTFRASDGVLDSNVATVHIGVQPINDPPVAQDGAFKTREDTPFTGTLPVTDIDGGALDISIVQNGSRGTAVLTSPSSREFTYTPAPNQSGTDSVTFSVRDESLPGESTQGTITVTITPIDDLPAARAGASTTSEGAMVTGTLLGSDGDGDAVTFTITGAPTRGSAVVTDAATGAFSYTPAAGFAGLDSFTFTVGNAGGSSTARQTIYVVAASPQWPGQTALANVAAGGVQGNGYVQSGDISADGRYLTYWSDATNLVPNDSNGQFDVFVYDRLQQVTSRLSVSSSGQQSNGTSYWPRISADGSTVAFYSAASNLVAGDTNNRIDIFVHDRASATTTRITAAPDGTPANEVSFYPSLSADGRFVVFESLASNLVAGDTNNASDVFVHDRQTGITVRASEGAGGVQGDGGSNRASITGDGRYVAFVSTASNLIAGDGNGFADVFVRDMATGAVTRVSLGSRGEESNFHSANGEISANGRYVTFESSATNLVPGAAQSQAIYVHDRQSGSTTRVSGNDFGGAHTLRPVFAPSISADGRYVSFFTDAPLVTGDTNDNLDVFVHDREGGRTHRVSVASDGSQVSGWVSQARLSADGRFVMFTSQALGLVPSDMSSSQDLFVVGGAKLSARSAGVPAAGASFTIDVTFAYPGTPWTALSTVPWISVGSGTTGNGTVTVTVAPSTEFAGRSGVITVAAQPVTISQPGVQDTVPPRIVVTSPAEAATYGLHQAVTAAFACSDPESGMVECIGTVPSGVAIDTASAGSKTFRVSARDKAGNNTVRDVSYTVSQGIPSIAVTGGSFQFDGQPHAATATVTGVLGEPLGPATITYNGSSSVPVEPGTYTVVASFAGNGNYVPGQAAATLVIDRAKATLTLASTPNPSNALQIVTLIATVTAESVNPGTASGDVQFFDGATLLGRATVSGGTARITTASLLSGLHTLTASYAGDTRFSPAVSAAQPHTVQSIASSTVTALVVSPAPSAAGSPATLVAIVTPLGGALLPTGTVDFFDSATPIGSAPLTTIGGRQIATLTTSGLAAGLHVLVARYRGSAEFGGSDSPWTTHTVYAGAAPAATTTTVTTTPNPTAAGQQFYVVVQVRSPAGTPTGTVYLTINGAVVGALPLSASGGQGVAIAPLASGLPKGLYTFGAIYPGTAQFAASSSQSAYQCVECAAPATLIQR